MSVLAELPRYNLRRSSPAPTKRAPVATLTQPTKPVKKFDPIGALLREKTREERTGTGMVAIRAADKIVLMKEMDEEEEGSSDSDMDLGGAKPRAKGKLKAKAAMKTRSRSRAQDESEDEDEDEDARVAQKNAEVFLGKKGGKAVGKILENDLKEKAARQLAKENAEPLGVPLWAASTQDDGDVDMDAEVNIPPFTTKATNPVLRLLVKASRNNGESVKVVHTSDTLTSS